MTRVLRYIVLSLITGATVVVAGLGGTAHGASAQLRPGGLAPGEAPAKPNPDVHIVKALAGRSCTGYSSETTPPPTIRVLVHASSPGTPVIVTVPFETYVENVLPNEWFTSWKGESLKSGAVAAKNYGWFWVVHYGGYYQNAAHCFDVTDDTNFQVYKANTANDRTNDAVRATWNVVADERGSLLQTFYRATLTGNDAEACGAGVTATSQTLSQWGSQTCAATRTYQQILRTYYTGVRLVPTQPVRQLVTADDFDHNGRSDPAVFDPRTGDWAILGSAPVHYGVPGDVPSVSNQGDGWANVGVYRPSTGTWYSKDVFGRVRTLHFGTQGDQPVQAHYHGITEPTVDAVYRPATGTWFIYGQAPVRFGAAHDIPVPGRWVDPAADGYADQLAMYRPSTGMWYFRGRPAVHYGLPGDIPVPADYTGDGATDIALYRPGTGTWYLRGRAPVRFGVPGDIPVTGDFNGNGIADVAVFRPSTGTWYVLGQRAVTLGSAGDIPAGRAPLRD